MISRFEDVGSGTTERNGRTPADRALSIVLGEIDEMAKATLKSITLATLLRLLQHKTNAAAAAAEPRPGP